MADFEKMGEFYLGRRWDATAGAATPDLLLYDSPDLTTHAVCVGMTGSGKTGLGIALLEEAAIDGVPAIAVDPKGDLANILLTFPDLAPRDFEPWVDPADAARQGVTADALAARAAETWRKGLAEWGQDAARIARLRNAVDMSVYTPGNPAGRQLAILRSFAAPADAEPSARRDRVNSVASGLLGLAGIESDPVRSREHILLANLIDRAWSEGREPDLPGLIAGIQKPPFDRIGVLDLEGFYPATERFGLAMALNSLLASPGFAAWMEGEPLDIQRLLYTQAGKPRLSVISIAHLSDAERMFFVTLLLSELVGWMRAQSGTSSLRAVFYMDEIFGYFPPNSAPPSKLPMLTLLKQARAFGLGVVLATQNPVDLDYKGLGNAGTWFIGRLQTERDKARVIEGLESALSGAGAGFDRSEMDTLISSLGKRVFLMRNVHENAPVLFQTRWTMSYLRGPLTLPQIRRLESRPSAADMTAVPSAAAPAAPSVTASAPPASGAPPAGLADAPAAPPTTAPEGAARPILPTGTAEYFLAPREGGSGPLVYRPALLGIARLHFVDAKGGVDLWDTVNHVASIPGSALDAAWTESEQCADLKPRLETQPRAGAAFASLPAGITAARLSGWQKEYTSHLYQAAALSLFACGEMKSVSKPGETEGDFRIRLGQILRERRDEAVEKLRKKYASRLATLQEQVRRADERIDREKSQVKQQSMQTAISFGATVLGALFGRKMASIGTVGRAATSVRSAGRIMREKEDVTRAAEGADAVRQRLEATEQELEQEIARIGGEMTPEQLVVEPIRIAPRKSDISVGAVAVLWRPFRTGADQLPAPA